MIDFNLLVVFTHPDDEPFHPGGTLVLLDRHVVRSEVQAITPCEAGSWPLPCPDWAH